LKELDAAISKIIDQMGAASPADMGKVMGITSKQLTPVVAGKAIADSVKNLLS